MSNKMKYRLWFVQIVNPQALVSHLTPNLSQSDSNLYANKMGQLYCFESHDGFIKKKLLKYLDEVHYFLSWYNLQFGEKISIQKMESGLQFVGVSKIEAIKNPFTKKFMELENEDIFHLKVLDMQNQNEIKRWYEYCCLLCNNKWETCSVIITVQGIIIKVQNYIDDFLLFTSEFTYNSGAFDTGQQYGIELCNCHRKILIKANTVRDYYQFLYFLDHSLASNSIKKIKYEATSLIRYVNKVTFIVDAQDYFQKVAFAIEEAQQEIFMCGWWISPQLPLVRPYTPQNYKYRLDRLLQRKAEHGVRIYIIVFNSPPVIPNDSVYSENTLRNLHSNIKILSHPCNIIPDLWSHHEKAVVVDQKIGFMGGLDLCYGRYDGTDHPINSNSEFMYPGIEYNNNRIKDFANVSNYMKDGLSREFPRMPWHDVALKVQGRSVTDLSNHFIEYWNNTYLQNLVISEKSEQIKFIEEEAQYKVKNQSSPSKKVYPSNKKPIKKSEEPQSNLKNEITISNLVEIVEVQKKSKVQQGFQKLVKKSQNTMKQARDPSKIYDLVLSTKSLGLIKLEEQNWQNLKAQYSDHCQLLRSASEWSIGTIEDHVESSIYNAYLSVIKNAKRFIYIENQFFISAIGHPKSYVKNQIVNALYTRVQKAIKEKQKFKVVIFMPLMPGMEGDLSKDINMSIRLILHWQYQTIFAGEDSLYGRLSKITSNPKDYIQFFSLRQHGILNGNPVTELIYIHTKLLIADDEVVICGSANINDRSQLGDRDSQLAMIITQGKKVKKKINNQIVEVSQKIHNLRVQLYCEHFSFQAQECEDPLDEGLNKKIRGQASENTESYRAIFGCYPDDNIKLLKEIPKFMKKASLEVYQQLQSNIKGHVVEFPLEFLSQQLLSLNDLDIMHDLMT